MKLRIVEVEAAEGEAARIIQAVMGGAVAPVAAPVASTTEAPHRAIVPPAAVAAPMERRKPGSKKAPPAPASEPRDGSLPARVLEALRKKPMSSLELASALKLEPSQVYNACNVLKNRNAIESRNDDGSDGTRRYFLK